jgi:murein DD-endopeptidase MepM/ murein hydrolase activator NlpD
MSRHRTTARGILLLLTLCGAAAVAACANAGAKIEIVFPVVGAATYTDDFGDPRGSSRHEGNDIMAPKRSSAVAAEAGTIKFWTTSSSAGCMLYLYGESGTTYLYIHLNNDRTLKNDNKGKCVPGTAYAKGLHDGSHVDAGQLVGYVGDSGDANGIASHLHFEIHPKGGKAVDPFPYLQRAEALGGAAIPAPAAPAALRPLK